jgi:RimJ/RimL family protein N-acetyltransferase
MPAFLETDRLVLRGFTDADADHLYELNRDRDVMWFHSDDVPDIPGADQGEIEYALTREGWQAAATGQRP